MDKTKKPFLVSAHLPLSKLQNRSLPYLPKEESEEWVY